MKLYELKRDAGVKIYNKGISDGSDYIIFHHIDGMYSYCTTEKGGVVHLSASTPLVPCEDGYEISVNE